MRNILLLLLVLLSFDAQARIRPSFSQNFGNTCPGSSALCQPIPLNPVVYYNFMKGAIPAGVTYTRASTGWYFNSSGYLASAATNAPRFDYATPGSSTLFGLLIEPARTNKLLWDRDFTQNPWVATNATAALDQTGIDNVATSASSVTASAPNATICQSISQAATSSVFSVYLYRITGSGTISISQDNGLTYTTTTLTGSWKRFLHAAQSTLNPVMCIQIATSGDKIGVDVAQFEVGGEATSPIVTTSAAITRAADLVTSTTPWWNVNMGAYVINWRQSSSFAFGNTIMTFNNSGYSINVNNTNLQSPHDGQFVGVPSFVALNKTALNYSSPGGAYKQATNNTLYSNTRALPTKPTSVTFGTGPIWIQLFEYWNYALSNSQLQAFSN